MKRWWKSSAEMERRVLGKSRSAGGQKAAIQVFEGTNGISLKNTRNKIYRTADGAGAYHARCWGEPSTEADSQSTGLGEIYAEKSADINGQPLNPVSRTYPRNYIRTGISSVLMRLMTLIRGQKLPIFSGSGMNHNKLAVQIVRQAKICR